MDPVTLEIVHGKLLATVDEMGTVLARTSMSPVIYEVLDFACGICDPKGDLIAQANGLTLFTGTFAAQVRFIIEKHGDRMRPGDAFITNDPFHGGTHCCDMAVIKPLFAGDQLMGFAISVAHWLDVGGAVAGSLPADATEVFQEGLRLPGIHLCREDVLLDDVRDIIAANSRLPKMALGDLNAELAAVNIAAARIGELCERYGAEGLKQAFDTILDTGEKEARAALRALPDGTYEAQDWIDGDGRSDERIPVQVKVTISGDAITADFTGSAAARPGPINCTAGALQSAVKSVFKALVGPHAPSNEGWFRPVRIDVPDGTVFSAVSPSPIGWYYEGAAQASELVWKALAPLAPEKFSAGSYMSLCATYICGEDRSGAPYVHIEPQHGGWGATPERDGASGLIAITDGDTYNLSVELLEAKYPLRLRRYGFNTDEGPGAGRFRGGYGLVREYEVLGDNAFTYASMGRSVERPWGEDGGGEGSRNYMEITRNGATERVARIPHADLSRGDRVSIVTGGGGGWGDPGLRSPDAVAADVADGLLTEAEAKAVYGS
ncbi:hydantoinase B/oxoprolinase family protein [Minwuia sp.]|uniref:hydantoinase B/oxoprolinase family protein n=1 Tax=Minwuia sp. TaxID=2493630 RepID=UPI003A8F9F92